MVYEVRNHWFVLNNGKKIELTNKEHELLVALSGETLVTYEELAKSMYNCEFQYVENTIRVFKCGLMKKAKVNIRTVIGKGYILKTKILFK